MLCPLLRSRLHGLTLLPLLAALGLLGCTAKGSGDSDNFFGVLDMDQVGTGDAATGGAPPPGPGESSAASGGSGGSGGQGGAGGSSCGPDIASPDVTLSGATDPEAGDFTLDEALAGLPDGPGPLRAILDTDLGAVTCELRPDKAPIGVANFVGLARGVRAWKDPLKMSWVKRRFYDGLLFYKVSPGNLIFSGDLTGDGKSSVGYTFSNEISDLKHAPGTLGYAHLTNGLNGSQFYITATTIPSADGVNTIFGLCTPVSAVTDISNVPINGSGQPITAVHLKSVVITRCAP
jgi:peptidyl-prolyl cis-trans isomerase A (cyclophilin A)